VSDSELYQLTLHHDTRPETYLQFERERLVRRHDPSVAATARPTGKAAARVDDWVASYASGVSPERR
jgi:hypothetical protein